MIKLIMDLLQIYVIVRLVIGAVRLFRGKNKGIMGKTMLLIKRNINRRLDKALERQIVLSGKKVIDFKKHKRVAK
jgi:hypothetical protein